MPEMNGIEATRRIVAAQPDVVVFLCSTYDVADLPPEAADSGAGAYVNKEHLAPTLLRRLWAERSSGSFAAADRYPREAAGRDGLRCGRWILMVR